MDLQGKCCIQVSPCFEKVSKCWPTSTVHVFQRLTMFAVNTGIWTATFAVLALILVRIVRPLLAGSPAFFSFRA